MGHHYTEESLQGIFGPANEFNKKLLLILKNEAQDTRTSESLAREVMENMERCINTSVKPESACELIRLIGLKLSEPDKTRHLELFSSKLQDVNLIFIKNLEQILQCIKNSESSYIASNNTNSPQNKLDKDLSELKHLFLKVLCYLNVNSLSQGFIGLLTSILKDALGNTDFNLIEVCGSLLCGSPLYLKSFYEELQTQQINFLSSDYKNQYYTKEDCKSLFLSCVKENKHISSIVYNYFLSDSSLSLLHNSPANEIWGKKFHHLILLHNWCLTQNNADFLCKTEKLLSLFPDSDIFLTKLVLRMKTNIYKAQKCISYHKWLNINRFLDLLWNNSFLYAIQTTNALSFMPYEVLSRLILEEDSKENREMNYAALYTYQAYFALYLSFRAVTAGIEMDKITSIWRERKSKAVGFLNGTILHNVNLSVDESELNRCKIYYKNNIVSRLMHVQNIIGCIENPIYRLEVLENLFSLFFLKHSDLNDVDSVSDGNLYERGMGKIKVPIYSVSEKGIYKFKNQRGNNLKGSRSSSSTALDDSEFNCADALLSPFKLWSVTSSDCSSSSISDLPRCGYVMNALVGLDILALLNTAVIDLKKESVSFEEWNPLVLSVSSSEYSDRLNSLEKRVNHGIWRSEIIYGLSKREMGSDREIEDYMKGSFTCRISTVYHYEKISPFSSHKKLKTSSKRSQTFRDYSITNYLLSSPQDLINICLMNENFEFGRSIIEKRENFGGEGELNLTQSLNEITSEIENLTDHHNISDHSPNLGISANEMKIMDFLEQILNIACLNSSKSTTDSLFATQCSKLILLDLALTADIRMNIASKLFNLGKEQNFLPMKENLPSVYAHKLKYFDHSYPPISEISALINKINACSVRSTGLNQLIPGIKSCRDLIVNILPFDRHNFFSFQELCDDLTSQISEIKVISSSNENENELKLSQIQVVSLKLKGLITGLWDLDQRNNIDFLSFFIEYLKLVKSVFEKYLSSECYSKIFDLLNKEPVNILAELIFSGSVCPSQLEDEFSSMNLDVLSLMIRYIVTSLDFSSLSSFGVSHRILTLEDYGSCLESGKYVLNGGPETNSEVPCDFLAVRELLVSLTNVIWNCDANINCFECRLSSLPKINFLSILESDDVRKLLLRTSFLKTVHLSFLKEDVFQTLLFFVDLANLMFLHSVMLNLVIFGSVKSGLISESQFERVLTSKMVGYTVNGFGFLSLFDVLFNILKLDKIGSSKVSKKLYSMLKFPLPSEEFTDKLHDYLEPLLLSIKKQSESRKPLKSFKLEFHDQINDSLPSNIVSSMGFPFIQDKCSVHDFKIDPVLYTFLMHHPDGWDTAVDGLEKLFLNNISLVSCIEKLKSFASSKVKPVTIIENRSVLAFECLKIDTTEDLVKTEALVNLPPSCSRYFHDKCPVLSFLMYSLKMFNSDMNEFFKEEFSESNDLKISYLQAILKNTKMYRSTLPCIQSTFQNRKVHSTLELNHFIQAVTHEIEKFLEVSREDIFRTDSKHALQGVVPIMEILSELPFMLISTSPVFSYLWDFFMGVKAANLTVEEEPWLYIFKIQNRDVKFEVVSESYKKWPIEASLHSWRFLSQEKSLSSSQRQTAMTQARRLDLCRKILNLPLGQKSFSTWQEIESADDVVQQLLIFHRYSLALHWIDCYGYHGEDDELRTKICLYQCLESSTPNLNDAEYFLDTLKDEECGHELVGLLDKTNVLKIRRFLMGYYLENFDRFKDTVSLSAASVRQELMGIVLYEDVAPKEVAKTQLFTLLHRPGLIVEQWIMNLKFDLVSKAVEVLSPMMTTSVEEESVNVDGCLCLDSLYSLLEDYAAKSLDMSGVYSPDRESSMEASRDPNKLVIPTRVPSKSEWEKDSLVSSCPICKTVFSLFFRKHHCRRCGRVICADCSKHRLEVDGFGDVPVRVCSHCYVNRFSKRFFKQTEPDHSDNSSIDDLTISFENVSLNSDVDWCLSTDSVHNDFVRKEFSFDCTPSLTVCYSIVCIHGDGFRAAKCLLDLAFKLLNVAVDVVCRESPEIDPLFLLQIVKTLISTSKLRLSEIFHNSGVILCEYYSQWTSFLQDISSKNCIRLLPPGLLPNLLSTLDLRIKGLSGNETETVEIANKLKTERNLLKILRDNLIREQIWDLALDISTKAGFESSSIWSIRAMSTLKAGDFSSARKYFSKVLKRPGDKIIPVKSAALEEIVSYLESSPSFYEAESCLDSFETNFNARDPCIVRSSLQNLDVFLKNYNSIDSNCLDFILPSPADRVSLSPVHERECVYFLQTYGSYRTLIRFYMRHDRFKSALQYSLSEKVPVYIFTEEIFITSFRTGKFELLWNELSKMDSDNELCASLVHETSKYLEKKGYLHCLLEIQTVLSDFLRASMTLIQLYVRNADSYSELIHRNEYLNDAISYLQRYLNFVSLNKNSQRSSSKGRPKNLEDLRLNWPSWTVNRHSNLCEFQNHISKYFSALEKSGCELKPTVDLVRKVIKRNKMCSEPVQSKDRSSFEVPTVFSGQNRLLTCVLALCVGRDASANVSHVYRLVETNSVDPKVLFSVVLQSLTEMAKWDSITKVTRGIMEWGLITPSEVRPTLWPSLNYMGNQVPEFVLKDLALFLNTPKDKMDFFAEVGLLKLAFFQVNSGECLSHVEELREAALKKGDKVVAFYCDKWIRQRKK